MWGSLLSIGTVMSLLVQKLAADCQHMDKFYMNHTLWLPDLCTICTCLDPVSVCENVRCLNPNCFYAKGEYLQIPHDGCCPECVGTLAPCRQGSKTFAHNTDWYPDPCSHCTCWDGDVTCSAVACPRQNCKPGTVAQTLPGQCCPQCIASGSSCSVDGVTYDDGHEWSPLPCTKCVCQDGTASCFPIQCPPLVCPPGQHVERNPHSCCPVCKSQMCSDGIKQHQNKESWQKDECTYCTCLQGETVCRKEECVDPKELECGKSERKVRRPGECCIECVSGRDSCKSEIPVRYHGDVWNISACEFCLCENGQVQCHKAMCEPLICELYETKVHLDGKCCPECMEQPRCYSNGEIFLDGDTWYPDPCSICSCKEGHITCYHKPCPVCPQSQVSVIHPGECCGTCKPLRCGEACSVCRPDNPEYCLVCKQSGLYLQDGKCLTSCQENFYVTRNRKCGECHDTCVSCTGATQHHCVKCKPGLLWRGGQCVPRCGSNFYQNGGQCLACHSSCQECLGPNKDNCLSCTISGQVLLAGQCVNDCGPQYYIKDGKCTSCQPTCSSCSSDGRFCTNCTQSLVLHKGQCVTGCPWGYYISLQGVCTACHPSCKKCSGPREVDCLTCLDGSPPRKGGQCPGNCVSGEYRDTSGNCTKCEPGCVRCRATDSGQGSVCVECPSPMMAFDNICVRHCPIGHFNQSSICQKCSSGCVECTSPSQCMRCGPSLLLSAGVCVLYCHPDQVIDSLHSVCQDCPTNCLGCSTPDECMQCDDITYLKMGVCVSACGQGFYQNPETRQCTANQHRPTLQVIGQIQVEQGGVVSITGDTFSLSDSDTSKDDLHLIVTEPTSMGKLVKAVQGNDGILESGGTFSLADLETGKIRFIHNAGNDRKGMIKLRVTDGQLYSEERMLHILVIPKNPPYLRKHESLLAYLENTTTIGPQQVDIQVDSLENSVSITVLRGPSHGQIVNRDNDVPVSEVTLKDWTNEKLAYKIGKSQATSDRVLFQVFDGYHSLNFLLDITIRKQEDVLPLIIQNNMGHVVKGQMLQLTSELLSAKVMDTNNAPSDDIIFTLSPPVNNPKEGELKMVVQQPEDGPGRGWEDVGDGKMSAKMFRFLQRDINEGRIWYKHMGASKDADFFTFEVSDTAKHPNILRDQVFHILVTDEEVTTAVPTVAPGTKLGISVLENQVTAISSTNLAYQDRDTEDKDIIYNIVRLLAQGEGSVEYLSHPFTPITRFTQEDINNNRVLYRPPDTELGAQEREFFFIFTVSDDTTNNTKEERFTIRVIPVNNEPPRFSYHNAPLQVPRGGSVPLGLPVLGVLDPDTAKEDLRFTLTMMPNHGQMEKILNNSKVFLRQGDTFSYGEIQTNSFQYTQDKSDPAVSDRLEVQVSDGVHQVSTRINMSIIRVDNSAPVLLPTATCRVLVKEGETVVLQRTNLGFMDEEDRDDRLRIILNSYIAHGSFKYKAARLLQKGSSFTQQDINDGYISYTADKEIGIQPITEVLILNVTDSRQNLLPNQVLSIVVEPVDNQPPSVIVGEDIKVEEGKIVPLSLRNIKVTDMDSSVGHLSVLIRRGPSFGRIVSTKTEVSSEVDKGPAIVASFSIQDLVEEHIYYEQSDHRNKEAVWDGFLFTVTDGNNTTPVYRINISITLVNDELPSLITEQLFVKEDNYVILTNASLYVTDLDTPPKDLIITVISEPTQGSFGLKTNAGHLYPVIKELIKGHRFTYQNVLDDLMVYRHMGGNIKSDSLTLSVSDGDFQVEGTLPIVIGIVNDETPRVSVNRGLRVNTGSMTFIKSKDLQSTDIDSEDSMLLYTITQDTPAGHLQYVKGGNSARISSKGKIRTFLQSDINSGYIQFVHQAGEMTGVVLVKFDVEDSEGNKLIDQDFFITIIEDRHPPQALANRELIVKEGSNARLTSHFLSYTDVDSEPASLQYFLVSAPKLGHLELTGNPGIPVSEFSQSDIAANSVVYYHTSPTENYMDALTYTVTDGTNQVTHKFTITVVPVDDEIPLVINNGLTVQEGVRKVITEFELKAVDQDTEEKQLQFSVVNAPRHGSLQTSDGTVYHTVSSFTMADIYDNRVSYLHDGSETQADSFSFTVTDGTTKMFSMQRDGRRGDISVPSPNPQDFNIEVLPLDDGMPVLHTNLGLQFLENSNGQISNFITNKELLATDVDTPPNRVMYHVTRQPRYGQLERTETPGRPISSFSQVDLNNQKIRYVLMGDITVAQDYFVFDLMDSKPNTVVGNKFYITWSYIEFDHILVNVTETAGIVQVPVNRKGNLKQYCVVSCRTVPLTATSQTVSSRPGTQDFVEKTGQIQFEEMQDSKMCNIIINDDSLYEGTEKFYVEVYQPIYTLLGRKNRATVSILDPEDEPLLQFNQSVYHISENDGYLQATITRSGDVSDSVSVVCYTIPLTSRGSGPDRLESGSDYITRTHSNRNRVIFPAGVITASCSVRVIDDSIFESSEELELRLADPSYNARIGLLSSATVIIDGPNDESSIHWSLPYYHFDEDAGDVEVEILRSGSDLSHTSVVWCATRLSEPPSATPGEDYLPSSSQITFQPGQSSQKCRLTLLDDSVEPRLEGNETFVIWLSTPVGSSLGIPHTAVVTIYDSHLDIPTMEFTYTEMIIKESDRVVHIPIRRLGDTSQNSSVICYTRQSTAVVMMDYNERPLTEASRITFLPGEQMKNCSVGIVDDNDNEPVEFFFVWLTQPKAIKDTTAAVGDQVKVKITIINPEDAPTLQFEQEEYTIHEPSLGEHSGTVSLRIIRNGDVSGTSRVRCSTRDGSAVSGKDYNPKSQIITFSPGERYIDFPVEILHNNNIEWHESFRVVLGPEDPTGAGLGDWALATVTILDDEVSGSLIFPAPPMVVSLLHFDNIPKDYKEDPSPGYPLVCVSPCDTQYPSYSITHSLCQQSGINQSAVSYRWEVAMPTTYHGTRPPFVMVTDNTPFTSVDSKVLDSIYFRPSFRVRCTIQPLNSNGNPGIPSKSHEVSINHKNGICNSPVFRGTPSSYSAQSFLANLKYVGPGDRKHPNTVHISISVPHQDGHLPLISTYPIHNLRYLLAEPVYRQQHLCSNFISPGELAGIANSAFLGSAQAEPSLYKFPHQFDPAFRENKTLNLYRHLNMKSCMWKFDAWYHMTDLVDVCGGKVKSDFQVKDSGKTYLTVTVPLYVYYVYATAPIGWGSLQHHTQMEFSFYYDTILWHTGLETKGTISGDLQVLKILVGRDGKLIVDFKTHARFRGLYVIQHHTLPNVKSRVISPEGVSLHMDLTLVWGQQTFDSPQQLWRTSSDFSVKDYTGTYILELVPCTVHPTQKYISNQSPIPCTAQPPQRFEVPIAFQQSNHPVPLVYSLDTSFQLTSNKKVFLMDIHDEQLKEEMKYDGVFDHGQTVYGRVSWNPEQDLKAAYKLSIQKVYLCTGKNGFVPNYDPDGNIFGEGKQYGCVRPSPDLQYRFLILDRGNADVTQKKFEGIPFNAKFASNSVKLHSLETFPGVDGFSFSVDPLYKVSSGNQWYLQVIYLITTSESDSGFHHVKRSAGLHRRKRDTSSLQDVLKSIEENGRKNGTNICHLPLMNAQTDQIGDVSLNSSPDQSENTPPTSSFTAVPIVIPVLCVLLCVIIIVIFIVYRRKKRRKQYQSSQEKQCALDSAAQNPICQRQIQRNSLSFSRINVNVKELKDSTVTQGEGDRTASVDLTISRDNTQSSRKKLKGTEV